MLIKYSELKKKDVLNVETGKNLGKIIDLIIDEKCGQIQKIITSGKKMCLLPCDGEEIDYSKITKIGDDVILVSKRPNKNSFCGESACKEKGDSNCFPTCSEPSVCEPSSHFDFDEE